MKSKRTLGDRINRGFAGLIILLGIAMIIRCSVEVVKHEPETESYKSDVTADIPVLCAEDGLFSFAWKEAARWYDLPCDMLTYRQYSWYYSIENSENHGAIAEVGFTLDIPYDSVTQQQFNQRYLIDHENMGN